RTKMNKPNRLERLEDVLDAYVASDVNPNEALDEWIQRYPEYEQELTDFAVSWSLMRSLPPAPDAEEVDEDTLVLRGMSIVQNLLHEQSRESASESVVPFENLIAEGRVRGLKPGQLAQATKLGDSLLGKLNRRLIRYASVPQVLIKSLAEAIQSTPASVTAYLQERPKFAVAMEHRSEQAPELSEQEDFFDAVRADPTIRSEHTAYWLKLEQSMGTT
ncbi:MAG: hypothetical protein OXC95_08105, partial [Dehalococcoidia bacterium]|nr:hypothetical protein [Dehalococcoidia bacterium]